MQLQFLGSGDAFGSGGRFNTCMAVTWPGGAFLIDCGASSLIAMRRFGIEPNAIDTIFISHLHGDHFGGLPFFILDAQFYSRREAPLAIVGPVGMAERLRTAMEVFFPGSADAKRKFVMEVHEIAAGETRSFGGVTASAVEVQHACGAPPLALRLTAGGKTIAYSGDTEWTDALIDISRDADLFVVEALSNDKPIRHHLSYDALCRNLDRLSARQIVLTHMGPDMLAHRGAARHRIAEDGLVVTL